MVQLENRESSFCPPTARLDARDYCDSEKIFFRVTTFVLACTQAVGWSKKPEFVMRSPSWIRAARSKPG